MRRKLESLLFGNSKNIKYYAMNGILFTMVSVLSRSYAIKFLDRVGGTELHFSLFNALPGLFDLEREPPPPRPKPRVPAQTASMESAAESV